MNGFDKLGEKIHFTDKKLNALTDALLGDHEWRNNPGRFRDESEGRIREHIEYWVKFHAEQVHRPGVEHVINERLNASMQKYLDPYLKKINDFENRLSNLENRLNSYATVTEDVRMEISKGIQDELQHLREIRHHLEKP